MDDELDESGIINSIGTCQGSTTVAKAVAETPTMD